MLRGRTVRCQLPSEFRLSRRMRWLGCDIVRSKISKELSASIFRAETSLVPVFQTTGRPFPEELCLSPSTSVHTHIKYHDQGKVVPYLITHQDMKTWGVEVELHTFLTSVLKWRQMVSFTPQSLCSWELEALGTLDNRLGGPCSTWDCCWKVTTLTELSQIWQIN
jgi:hypothetical protein